MGVALPGCGAVSYTHLDVYKRQVERVWTTVNDLAQSKYFASMMALLDYKELAKSASDPRMQQFLRIIGDVAPDIKKFKDVARDERPFLPDLAWAYFSAYKSILVGSHIRFEVLKSGVDEPQKLLTSGGSKTILKAALPHQAKFIDEKDVYKRQDSDRARLR